MYKDVESDADKRKHSPDPEDGGKNSDGLICRRPFKAADRGLNRRATLTTARRLLDRAWLRMGMSCGRPKSLSTSTGRRRNTLRPSALRWISDDFFYPKPFANQTKLFFKNQHLRTPQKRRRIATMVNRSCPFSKSSAIVRLTASRRCGRRRSLWPSARNAVRPRRHGR